MALTQTQVSQLYVAIFNRASEGEGNTYWQTAVESISATASAMLDTPDAKAYFGTSLDSNQAFIEHIYKNTLGKTLEQDPDGIKYWVDLLDGGMSKGEIVAALIEAAQDPKNAGDAQDMFNNKVNVSDYTAVKIETVEEEDMDFFKNLIKDVTNDETSLNNAKESVDEKANQEITGDTTFLKVGQDFVEGTDNNDAFVSYVAQNQNGQQVNTLASGDVIDGGAGSDTLDAEVTTGAYVNGGANGSMDITPHTTSVENVIFHAELASTEMVSYVDPITGLPSATLMTNDVVTVNAKFMEGVTKIASNYSDASLVIKNMTTKGVAGGTAAQTVAMEYTGNKDTHWNESDMTVYYDQDYLTRSAVESNSLYYFTQDRLATQQDDRPFGQYTAVNGIQFRINGSEVVTIEIDQATLDAWLQNVPADGLTAYKEFAELLAQALAEKNTEMGGKLDGYTISLDENFYRTNGGENNGGDPLDQNAYAIVLTAPDGVKIDQPAMSQVDKYLPTYDMYNDVSADGQTTDIPVSINVDLEKVGLAADGGALTIGSMNKNGLNEFGDNQSITTTDTIAGFDEFNVHVSGDKSKNSSLSALESTDNTLRKVTIDSKAGSDANLTIGNSNTTNNAGNNVNFGAPQANANAFKDVQIMDASSFNGDLVLHAGFTNDIVEKYLANVTETTLYGLNDGKTELALFQYNGGNGNDTLDLSLNLYSFADGSFDAQYSTVLDEDGNVITTTTNGNNVFKMDIDGGAGNDNIILSSHPANAPQQTITNVTVNGGAGNDNITLDIVNFASSTYNVAFDGTSFGHDTIVAFDEGAVALTDEAQDIDLTGFAAHSGETIVVTVGGQAYTYNVTGTMADTDIATQVADMLGAAGVIKAFDTVTDNGDGTLDLAKTGANVNHVTVEVQQYVENTETYPDNVTIVHSAESNTTVQGGLLEGAAGADTLDFSSYNVGKIFVAGVDKTATALEVSQDGGTGSIHLVASAHDANVYDVYLNTTGDGQGTNAIGSIALQDEAGVAIDITTLDDTQFLI